MYQIHPSLTLQKLFKEKPYQGCCPIQAQYLFIGLDANYAADIEQQTIFPKLLEYHQDGVAFWKKYNIHHPFLDSSYRGDGRKYHKNLEKIGLSSIHADKISFIELLHLPTVGRSSLTMADLDDKHLDFLNKAIFSQKKKAVFISDSVYRLIKKAKKIPFLESPIHMEGTQLKLYFNGQPKIFKHFHFSYQYGKSNVLNQQAKDIFKIII